MGLTHVYFTGLFSSLSGSSLHGQQALSPYRKLGVGADLCLLYLVHHRRAGLHDFCLYVRKVGRRGLAALCLRHYHNGFHFDDIDRDTERVHCKQSGFSGARSVRGHCSIGGASSFPSLSTIEFTSR